MTSLLDRLFSAPSPLSWLSAANRRRARIDLRDLSPYVQRDIGLLDGDEALANRIVPPCRQPRIMPSAAPMPCVRR
ncbi:MAG: hypothetical protein J0I98_12945 [Mesorhizobium sp.]|nr:hypothetical protein [Mesorhizobium sp.]MBN9243690.1 hypothetical protein [Mesorhizobium sp.]MBN9271669.1 hypothetical protein [Mesorhizobium sp.]